MKYFCHFAISFVLLVLSIICFGYYFSKFNSIELSSISLSQWQQIAAIVFGGLGLILGYLYFISRIDIEKKNSKNERIRVRLMYIHNELKEADKLIEKIFRSQFWTSSQLLYLREDIDKRLEILANNYLEENENLIKFTKDELAKIVGLHSFFNNSKVLYFEKFFAIKFTLLRGEGDVATERYEYIEIFKAATNTCIHKLENL
jgi:hypothetical protein